LSNNIIIRGAREHNLKSIDLTLPRDKLTVITGPSGSGKSSLAFDTLYAEGQRRYVESLSAYARQFLEMMPKPDVDHIEGLSPAISIEQKTTSKNPRSTVATVTEIYDYLRLLFARVGIPYSPTTGQPIQAQTVGEMAERILKLKPGKIYVMAPIVRGRKGEYRKDIQDLKKRGFGRLQVNGEVYPIDDVPLLDKQKKHTISVVVDRLILKENPEDNQNLKQRITEALEMATNLADGLALVEHLDLGEKHLLSQKFSCPQSGFTLEELEPRLFSFNSPFGACGYCDGLGVQIRFDPEKIVPNPSLSLREGAIAPWSGGFSYYYQQILEALAAHYQFSTETPFEDLSSKAHKVLLYGSGREIVPMTLEDESRRHKTKKTFEGIIPMMERRHKERLKSGRPEEINRYQTTITCDKCQGYRLNPQALSVKINECHIGQVTDLSIDKARTWFQNVLPGLSLAQQKIAPRILKEIEDRLEFLAQVGVGYLNLSRAAGTLSGGESQRIRLASQIGSGLTGVLYVLDEPSIGLHQRDNTRLLETLKRLRDLGNSVVVVEHDEETIRAADYIVDMGPAAGVHGGEIIAQGTAKEIINTPKSLTGQYLAQTKQIPIPTQRRQSRKDYVLTIKGASANTLQHVDVTFPLGTFICITGVSGGGKSSLIIETLYKALAKIFYKAGDTPGPYQSLEGVEYIDKVIDIDQSPIGRTPRSNPATYTGLFSLIRDVFAALPEARARGYGPGRFSFNVKGGRCEACQGDGVMKVEMHFLPDMYITCDVCHGRRYNPSTLDILYKGKNIADILDMSVEEAYSFFEAIPNLRNKLKVLVDVGLGYIQVGQRATTLSGGEAQRVKLAKELSRRSTGKTLYILDEPTTGLHMNDIAKLLDVLHLLVDQGNTVLVIEHNLDVIKTADWIIDIGPEGGDKGGRIVATGPPEEVARIPKSYTGQYLKSYLMNTA
jgi:excinuclease ABC subunit A